MAGYHHGQPGPGSAGLGLPRQSMLETALGFPPLLAMAKRKERSVSVPKQQPILWETKALLSRERDHCAWLSCSACFQHPALISSQTGFYPWDTSSDFPFIQKEASILEHYRSTDNKYYKQQSSEGMPEPCCWLMPDLCKAHVTMSHHSAWLCKGNHPAQGHSVAGGAGPLLPHVLLLSGVQGAPHMAKDTPSKVWRAYLKDPAMKVVVDTHTEQSMYVVGERVWSQRPPLWHKVVLTRHLVVPRLLTASTDLSKEGTDGAGPPCLTSPHFTSRHLTTKEEEEQLPDDSSKQQWAFVLRKYL